MEIVYFFARDGLIKIGTTAVSVEIRLRQIELASPGGAISLIGSIGGGFQLERAIHNHLADHRIKGEWFKDCEEVRTCIAGLISKGPAFINFDVSTTRMGKVAREKAAVRDRVPNPLAFGAVARLIWPNTALKELCAFADADEVTVLRWLDGVECPPRLVRYAFASVAALYCVPGGPGTLSFLNGDPKIELNGLRSVA